MSAMAQPALALVANFAPAARSEAVRVAVVARDPLTRAGLMSIAGAFDDLDVVEELQPDDRLASRVRVLAPDVLLCDADVAASLAALDAPAVLLLSDPIRAAEALAAGARGLLMRNASPRRIHAALHAVAEGLMVVDEELSRAVLHAVRPPAEMAEPLTNRELEVMQLLAAGLTNKEIASRLGISDHTVKFHVNAILGKLGVETRTEAVVHAARLGIVVL
jgi:DNA-binding NarL/FixJ family response regulator